MAKPAQKELPKGNRPDYVLRARQAPGSDIFKTIGAAWRKTDKQGKEFFSVKINLMPVGFDGSFIMVEPLADSE